MEDRAHAMTAGLFAIVLSCMMLAALWWFSDRRESTRDLLLVTRGSVQGLNPQAIVRYRGMIAGKVAEITLDPKDPRLLLVRASIRDDLPITEGTRARLATQGVTGIAFISLEDAGNDTRPLAGNPPRIALESGTIEQLADASLQVMLRLKTVAERLQVLASDENMARLGNTLSSLESASRGADRTFREIQPTVAAIRQVLAPANLARISRTLDNLDQASGELSPMSKDVRALLERLQSVSEKLDAAAGASGEALTQTTLPRLNLLLQELTNTSRQVSDLLDELDTSPQLLLLGRGTPRPGPGERGFSPASAGSSPREP
ncbi:MAG: MCE family protein [Zoogloea sp.]|nr:MCE family protein [Zoogloea sp.]